MPWFYVDDGFADSKPVMMLDDRLRNEAVGLWLRCGAWSAKEETDGRVPIGIVRQFGGSARTVRALVSDAGLWEAAEVDDWRKNREILFKNWTKWQKSRQENVDRRKREADKKSTYRSRKKGRNYVPTSGNEEMSTGDNAVDSTVDSKDVSTGDSLYPDPTHKRTTQVPTELALSGGSGGRGSRLPDGWMPPQAVVAQMRSEHPEVDLKAEHAKFVDYWQSKAGKDARKVDWAATWRNWIRRAAEQQTRSSANGKPHKLRVIAELAAQARAEETAALAASNQPRKEINP